MTTDVVVPADALRRSFNYTSFTTFTAFPVLKVDHRGAWTITFDGALDAATVRAIYEWLTTRTDLELTRRQELAALALATNAAYLALPTPTQAQAIAQVRVLTRENSRIIRLLLNQLDVAE